MPAMQRLLRGVLSVGLLAAVVTAQDYPPAFPRINATALLETDRFVVWDIVWPKGQPTPLHRHVYDQVGTYYQAGGRVITNLDGTRREATTAVGALSNTRRGTTHVEEGVTDPPLRAVFIELRAEPGSARPASVAEAAMFPRPGARDVLDDARVTVWDYTWRPGEPAAEGGHAREAVWIWIAEGVLEVTPRGGVPSRLTVVPGQIRHVMPGTIERVGATSGTPRAVVVAIK
jgi:hypothetical protein